MYDGDVAEVDAFVGSHKSLDGLMPTWEQQIRGKWHVRWAIIDALGVQRGELSITCDSDHSHPTICCVYNQRLIYRLDIVPNSECKPNPFGASSLGLPKNVCGPHIHGWNENKEYVRINGLNNLPFRRPIKGLAQTLRDGLGWVAQQLDITVTGQQRDGCDLPPQGALL